MFGGVSTPKSIPFGPVYRCPANNSKQVGITD